MNALAVLLFFSVESTRHLCQRRGFQKREKENI
jgi:hypothetical protein